MYRLLSSTCVFMFTSGLIWTAAAQNSPAGPVVVTSGMVGIAEGQAAQINVLNPGGATSVAGCAAVLSFLDDQGNLLKSATVMVARGASQSLRVDADIDLKLTVDARREIRAEVQVPVPPPPSTAVTTPVTTPGCKLIPNVEVLDRITGRTQVVLGAGHIVPGVMPASGQ
jgi:hypothetical protein